MNFSKYPSIEQFRHTITSVERSSKWVYDKSTDDYVFDITKTCPTLTFTGTVKVHGTNAGVYFDKDGSFTGQKRTCGIGSGDGHFGFNSWLESEDVTNAFKGIRYELLDEYSQFLHGNDFVIYGEWCGGNIQKGVAISNLPKMFIIFGVKVITEDDANYWLNTNDYLGLHSVSNNIHDVKTFGTYSINIDFENPKLSSNIMSELTLRVEDECPVGKYFGVSGIGEGIVWSHWKEDGTVLKFKVKGVKHSSSKVKTLASVDVEKLNSITEFVEYVVTESRLQQCANEVLIDGDFDRKKLGQFMKWMSTDIVKEEKDTLVKNDLTMKDVGSGVSKACQKWFFTQEGDL